MEMSNPIINVTLEQRIPMKHLVEREIDQLVYKLYGLMEDEIAIVEGKNE